MSQHPIKLSHDEVRPCELSKEELKDCIREAEERGLGVQRETVEHAYEALLEGRSELAGRILSSALFPSGADSIKARVEAHRRQALRRIA